MVFQIAIEAPIPAISVQITDQVAIAAAFVSLALILPVLIAAVIVPLFAHVVGGSTFRHRNRRAKDESLARGVSIMGNYSTPWHLPRCLPCCRCSRSAWVTPC